MKRKVIVHYHVFKNAGTSLDKMLESCLGERWSEWDRQDSGAKISPEELEEYLLATPNLVAVSSHQIVPPLPSRVLDVYPLVFVRHPLDRAYSAYLFEWKKQRGTSEPVSSFDAYVREKLQYRRKNAIEDFQTLHFANRGYASRWPNLQLGDERLLSNAKSFLKGLPAFGLVDRFQQSMAWFKQAWGEHFPEVTFSELHANSMQNPGKSLAEKVDELRARLPSDSFAELVIRNQMDIRLYEYASALFDIRTEDISVG